MYSLEEKQLIRSTQQPLQLVKVCLLPCYFFLFIFSAIIYFVFFWTAFVFVLAEVEWLSVPPCQSTGDTVDACRRRLMRCPDSPKPGSSSGLCSRGLQRRTMTTAPVNYWYPNKQQKARDTEAIAEVTFYIVIELLNFCCIFVTAPKQTCFFLKIYLSYLLALLWLCNWLLN